MRTIVIGDIQAGLKALKELITKIRPTEKDRLIFLGDYVDGWSQAVETIHFLVELNQLFECVFLRGNHDSLALEWLEGGEKKPMWLIHGGAATIASYEAVEDPTLIEIHKNFYRNLEDYYLDSQNRLFVHAGFTHVNGASHEYFKAMCYWDRSLWETALAIHEKLSPMDEFYPKRLLNYKEIYIGHTPVTRIGKTIPVKAANVWNVDTGAAFKGPLTALDIDSKEIWQSTPVYQLYPQEKGRN